MIPNPLENLRRIFGLSRPRTFAINPKAYTLNSAFAGFFSSGFSSSAGAVALGLQKAKSFGGKYLGFGVWSSSLANGLQGVERM